MSEAGIIIRLRCFDCSKWCNPGEVVHVGESVIQCWDCYDKQRKIVESWDEPPSECAVCHTKFEELARQVPGQPVSMFVHWIDGTLGLLCSTCDQAYVRKRLDQFRGTRYGEELKL
jgi:hypothetical protein